MGQINAIREVFNVTPYLCYWHMKQALKKKMQSVNKEQGMFVSPEKEKEVLHLVLKHFNMHPSICPGMSGNDIYELNLSELRISLSAPGHSSFLQYLEKNWYAQEKYEYWGRRNESCGIPFSRTTMFVKGHWYVLKRNYLLFYNSPRVDFFVYLMDAKLMPKYAVHYRRLLEAVTTPFLVEGVF